MYLTSEIDNLRVNDSRSRSSSPVNLIDQSFHWNLPIAFVVHRNEPITADT